ncbi:MAG TPA: GIY-YIG nuclease family protein [Candidatus Tectomicrobia bacterium]
MSACTKLCRAAEAAPLPPGGTYTVLLWLPESCRVVIGRLGCQVFPGGYYTYTGSARRGLKARLHRHLHGAATRHWHLDYLRPHVRVLAWAAYTGDSQPECQLNQQLARQGQVVVSKFGASDCSCPSHLLYYPGTRRPRWRVLTAAQEDSICSAIPDPVGHV